MEVVTPRLKKTYFVIAGLFALLLVNSLYLVGTTLTEKVLQKNVEDGLYLWMFLAHLILGLIITIPVIGFGILHMRMAWQHPNRRARNLGLALFSTSIILLLTGIVLTRVDIGPVRFGVTDPSWRIANYALHVITPVMVIVLFILHRKEAGRIYWKDGLKWGGAAVAAFIVVGLWHGTVMASKGRPPIGGEQYFQPSLVRTSTGNLADLDDFTFDTECIACHEDSVKTHEQSVHNFSSFNNPFYAFSVRNTRKAMYERDGNVHASRFCAGCHDPVPFLTGAFELEKWDDPSYDVASDPLGKASLTCTACHGIVGLDGVQGNGGYVFEAPKPYPFQSSGNPFLTWVNHSLIKARPSFHKRSFLKPEIHRSAEFCASCHKVFIPEELTHYKWARGQDHYDSWRTSGVSGNGIESWYYPPKADLNCNGCHMQSIASADLGAERMDDSGQLKIPSHAFPSGNPAIAAYLDLPCKDEVLANTIEFNKGVFRADIIALREGASVGAEAIAPLRPEVPALKRGQEYLIDVLMRTVKMGHMFTQGTSDSNETWIEVELTSGDRRIGLSGGMDDVGAVDPWSKFLNAYIVDRDGNHIVLRNVQDIFTALYNHQIPPGAADLTHYKFVVPEDAGPTVTVTATMKYRKFTHVYTEAVAGKPIVMDLPILVLATDSVTFPVAPRDGNDPIAKMAVQESAIPLWQRWYDYGIGAMRHEAGMTKGNLRLAQQCFTKVEELQGGIGAAARGRAFLVEGRIDDAAEAFARAGEGAMPAFPWMHEYWVARINRERGALQEAAKGFETVLATPWPMAKERQFDFSRDERVWLALAEVRFELARQAEPTDSTASTVLLATAQDAVSEALVLDPENIRGWYLRMQLAVAQGDTALEGKAQSQYLRYKPDDNAADRALRLAREQDAAANAAAEAIVIYDLQRESAFNRVSTNE
ncbi:MAG: hypothetical protein O2819_03255 [Planctomycetota bacterium]|nr:hypothetical protein [Planctomycetota bacterium]MDA1105756.1 hypothetical protein [Planctomycetota bacterium]